MQLAKYLKALVLFTLFGMLAACNGSSDSGSSNSGNNGGSSSGFSLVFKDASGLAKTSFPVESQFSAEVTLLSNGQPVSGTTVTFASSSSFAVVDNQAVTNDSGVASVNVALSSGLTTTATITATATVNGVVRQSKLDFTPLSRDGQTLPVIALQLLNVESNHCGPTSIGPSFAQNQAFCIRATVTRNGAAIVNQPVTFTAGVGTLNQSSRLTNSEGQADVIVTNAQGAVGAAVLGASIADASINVNYEYLAGTTVEESQGKLSLNLSQDGKSLKQLRAGLETQLTATVTNGQGQPLADQIITFSLGLGTLPVTTALTDAKGMASVTFTPANTDLGASTAQASLVVSGNTISDSSVYEILAADALLQSVLLGSLSDNGVFTQGKIQLNESSISAGGTVGLTVDVVDAANTSQRITTPTQITFSSNCATDNNGQITATVTTVNGRAQATFRDDGCSVSGDIADSFQAQLQSGNQTMVATAELTISAETLGSIQFISADQTDLVIKGAGGQGKFESALLTFRLVGNQGNALPQRTVSFSLDTDIGGITFGNGKTAESGLTNSNGDISIRVQSGLVPTPVRVTASAQNGQQTLTTQSDLLSINTGLPDQNSMTLAANVLNPEAGNFKGNTVNISAWLADSFNNPVPDGTTVNFTAEGGDIVGSCNTTGGSCSVIWTGVNPVPDNHRITILATAIGHETFYDTNGNGQFDDNDLRCPNNSTPMITTSALVSSGYGAAQSQCGGFVDLADAWRDDNENLVRDSGEPFFNFQNNAQYNNADGKFNGPHCSGNSCSASRTLYVRKAIQLIMAGSSAQLRLTSNNIRYFDTVSNASTTSIPSLNAGIDRAFQLDFRDNAGQTLPANTTISVTSSAGELAGTTSYTVPNQFAPASRRPLPHDPNWVDSITFTLRNSIDPRVSGTPSQTALLTVTVTTPAGFETSFTREVTLNGT